MEDIRPKGAWYAVRLNITPGAKPAVVDVHTLANCLPHGSGIDGEWTIEVKRNGDITVHGEYHAMNENGFYCGWRNFRFSLRKHTGRNEVKALSGPCLGQFQVIRITGKVYFTAFVGGGDALDCLYDTCYFAIADAMDIHAMESGVTCDSEVSALARR